MSRQSRFGNTLPPARDERQSIGDGYVQEACNDLNKFCQRTMAALTNYDLTREATLPMLFRDDDIDKLQQVLGMVKPSALIENYSLSQNVDLYINFDGARVPTIMPKRLCVHPQRVQPLMKFIADVKAIHDKFEEAKGVLRWFNRNATPGAIRYYFPAALKLCPASPPLASLQHVPSRYTNPAQIGDWIETIKQAAATVAATALLPSTAQARPKETMWLTFSSQTVHPTLDTNYTTDQMVYNI